MSLGCLCIEGYIPKEKMEPGPEYHRCCWIGVAYALEWEVEFGGIRVETLCKSPCK